MTVYHTLKQDDREQCRRTILHWIVPESTNLSYTQDHGLRCCLKPPYKKWAWN